jgi:hypothetical protein
VLGHSTHAVMSSLYDSKKPINFLARWKIRVPVYYINFVLEWKES